MTENAKKLVAALRSGEYEQGTGRLRHNDNFCCLGVACDLYQKETGKGRWVDDRHRWEAGSTFIVPGESSGEWVEDYYLPPPVMRWLGFGNRGGGWDNAPNDHGSLIALNDRGQSFGEIADTIETQKGLFRPEAW